MSVGAQETLERIKTLVDAGDAAALVQLQEDSDKAVRKAVRKGIHRLRSRESRFPKLA